MRRHHDASVRTTLTLDPDVARLLEEEVHRARKSLKSVVNEVLRRGLTGGATTRKLPKYRVAPHAAVLRPGFDRAAFNGLADELEDAAALERLSRRGRGAP
jgi:inactivated superfamily I helicase